MPISHSNDAMCLMSTQVCAFLFQAMNLQSGSLSLPENNELRNKAAQFHYQLSRLNEQCRHPPPPHHQCNVCASYLISAIPPLPPLSFFFLPPQLPALLGEDLLGGDRDGRPVPQGKAARPMTFNPPPQLPLTRPIRGRSGFWKGGQQESKNNDVFT